VWRDLIWHARGGVAAETVATLLEGGGELLEGLELARQAAGDPVLGERLERARSRVREGAGAAEALAEEHVLPPEPAAVALIGSRSGDLAGGLRAAAESCGEQRELLTSRLVALINPAVMIGMGAVVGWLFYSLLAGMLAVNDAGAL
jgi:general secretion pathway protein F